MSLEHEVPGELEDTDGYDLAQVESEEAGPLQRLPSDRNVAWKSSSRTIDEELVAGLSNEDVWMLIRRFNKQIYYVKAVTNTPSEELDLNRAEDEQFPPEKLRMTLERFYMSVIVGVTQFGNQIVRLRSWKEPIRTSIFCAVYFAAWFKDILVPTTMTILVTLILSPSIRSLLFPAPPPPSQSGAETNHDKNATVGEATSQDSVTGAPERYKGEAAEQEARNMVNNVANIAMESAAARYGQGIIPDDESTTSEPVAGLITAAGEEGDPSSPTTEDKTKKPMKKKVAQATDKTMAIISDITDIYEKFANIFSPTPPFFLVTPRLRLVGMLTGVSVASMVTSSHVLVKAVAFLVGFAFFGDPIMSRSMAVLNKCVPDWKKHLDLQQTILKGVPNNAQLTLTLLRIGELNSSPLPPPPTSATDEPSWPIKRKKSKAAVAALADTAANSTSPSSSTPETPSSDGAAPKKARRRWVRILKFVRRSIATAIKGHMAIDRAMAMVGSEQTKNLLGLLSQRGWISAPFGPLKFDAKFERKRGAVVIDSSSEPPVLYFTTSASASLDDLRLESRKKGSVLFQIPVPEIRELKKTEGLGWKGKLIVELTAGSKEAADGLIVVGAEAGQSYHVTGMRARNVLFNRLVAIGSQFWETSVLAKYDLAYKSASHNEDLLVRTRLHAILLKTLATYKRQELGLRDDDTEPIKSLYFELGKRIKLPLIYNGRERILTGNLDYSLSYGVTDTNLVVVKVKTGESGSVQALGYMAMIHRARKLAKKPNTVLYGVSTDTHWWEFIRLDPQSRVSNLSQLRSY
ncbi:hypothetical protein FE257_011117 [Aspergillus nanangensis]|uniref:Uncharacterized protein n=1 Tax=Aspergillus nanangensis TaxID=2582783 RepID=A0AAD4CHT5_ASPNN|nr:hypothetical protein FE257_011117 [Aspergillus nanangensis]